MGLGSARRTALVTGAAGFLGSHLVDRLLAEGFEVVGLDNLMTGDLTNLSEASRNPHFHFQAGDVREPMHVYAEVIFNLACPASPVHYQHDPYATFTTSVLGAQRVIEMARGRPCTVIHASTSEVYGDPQVHPQPETYWGHVNPIGERACYDAETEILTDSGWVPFPELREGARVATLAPDGRIEYHVPDELICYPYVGELLRFVNEKFDLCVTPNHRMYVRSKTGKLRFLRADEDRHWPSWRVPTGGSFEGLEREWMEFGAAPANAKVQLHPVRMDDWLEFLGYYISEGCVHVRRRVREVNGREYAVADFNVLIAQQDPEGRSKIGDCLRRLGWNFFDSDHHQFRICSSQLTAILAPLGKSGDKFIPREYLGLCPRQSRILLDALVLGDGSRRGDRIVYYTKSRRLADDVQELALRCGYAANMNLTPGRDLYRVNIRRPRDALLVEPERVRYAGRVYCVDVRNHVVCVRRNGRTAFCGNCYDEGKRGAETLLNDARRRWNVDTRIVRIFNTYGPRMAQGDGRVVSNFIIQALQGEPITLFGDGEQTRSFCYVDDLIEGILGVSRLSSLSFPMNLGNAGEFTVAELAELVLELTGSKSVIEKKPLPADDPRQRRPDLTRARELIGYEPRVPLRVGIERTIAHFRERLG